MQALDMDEESSKGMTMCGFRSLEVSTPNMTIAGIGIKKVVSLIWKGLKLPRTSSSRALSGGWIWEQYGPLEGLVTVLERKTGYKTTKLPEMIVYDASES